MVSLFDVPAFLILFRETIEYSIILAVLFSFIDKIVPEDNNELRKTLKRQIWIGTAAALSLIFIIGVIFIIIFYTVASNLWEHSEDVWEGVFSLFAAIVTFVMAFGMVKVNQWKTKWEGKLKEATEKHLDKHKNGEKWALIILAFTVVAKEGLEAFVFIAGIGFNKPASSLPIPVITGTIAGIVAGYLLYKGSSVMSMNIFFTSMTTLLFFISAGLFTTSVHAFVEVAEGADDNGSGGDDEIVLWNLNCCNEETNRGWEIANALFGWRHKATLDTTLAYIAAWIAISAGLFFIYYKEKRKRIKETVTDDPEKEIESSPQ
ncbi:6447_t:CDS:2 [Paraglomus occultum]|uniref:6447_t:CDS:1 n=1 Tax=Paraglomus occultum TaxID=144539 RepID=A0A9N9FF75_9GLOM|nr:6447_t:CDS:2 [Paraglomus occultum]